jgi:hypothetical protein
VITAGARLVPADIASIWRRINPAITPTEYENWRMVSVASYWDATVRCVAEQNRGELGAAQKKLLKWTQAYRADRERLLAPLAEKGVDRQRLRLAFDDRILNLEQALRSVEELVRPMPARQSPWAPIAQMVWQEAQYTLETLGRRAGTAPKSYAVRFTSEVLHHLGYPKATQHAVAAVAKSFDFRISAAKAGTKDQGAIPTQTPRL